MLRSAPYAITLHNAELLQIITGEEPPTTDGAQGRDPTLVRPQLHRSGTHPKSTSHIACF